MADTKLSALNELAATPAVDDEIYIRDVSELAAAESKRITIANLMAAGLTFTEIITAVHNPVGAAGWEDWDLSAIVGAGSVYVEVVMKRPASGSGLIGSRNNGSGVVRNVPTISQGSTKTMLTQCDGSRIIEIYGAAVTDEFYITGYWS